MTTRLIGFLVCGLAASNLVLAEITEQQAVNASTTFRQLASRAGGTVLIGSAPEPTVLAVDPTSNPLIFEIKYGDGWTNVQKSDGKVLGFRLEDRSTIDELWNSASALTTAQLTRLSQMYRNGAGFSGSVFLVKASPVLEGSTFYFDAEATVLNSDVPFGKAHNTFFEISHTTGRLLAMEAHETPTLPSRLQAKISLSQAHATFVSYLSASRDRTSLADIDPPKLAIWKPVAEIPAGADNFLTSQHAAIAARNEGMLVYDFYVEGRDVYGAASKAYIPRYAAYVDAMSGKLLVVYEYMPFGSKGAGKNNHIAPDFGPGPLTITDLNLQETIHFVEANPMATTAPGYKPRGRPILLKRGRLSILASINVKSGLIWTEQNGLRKYAKLDHHTALKLRRLLSEPVKSFSSDQ